MVVNWKKVNTKILMKQAHAEEKIIIIDRHVKEIIVKVTGKKDMLEVTSQISKRSNHQTESRNPLSAGNHLSMVPEMVTVSEKKSHLKLAEIAEE